MKCSDKLESLRRRYGNNVMYTNGLYHIMDNKREEVYIHEDSEEIDRRSKYKTLVVTDKIIAAKVLNGDMNYVILNKGDLRCLYKTKGDIEYIDENILCDKKEERVVLISHSGKILEKVDNVTGLYIIGRGKYILSNRAVYNDTVKQYRKTSDSLIDLTEGKRYLVYRSEDADEIVEVITMSGGKYRYNFRSHECKNLFTNELEKIHLWTTAK